MNDSDIKPAFISVDDISKEYLPVSKKTIRKLLKKYLTVTRIGGRMYVSRSDLEEILARTGNYTFKA